MGSCIHIPLGLPVNDGVWRTSSAVYHGVANVLKASEFWVENSEEKESIIEKLEARVKIWQCVPEQQRLSEPGFWIHRRELTLVHGLRSSISIWQAVQAVKIVGDSIDPPQVGPASNAEDLRAATLPGFDYLGPHRDILAPMYLRRQTFERLISIDEKPSRFVDTDTISRRRLLTTSRCSKSPDWNGARGVLFSVKGVGQGFLGSWPNSLREEHARKEEALRYISDTCEGFEA